MVIFTVTVHQPLGSLASSREIDAVRLALSALLARTALAVDLFALYSCLFASISDLSDQRPIRSHFGGSEK